MAYRGRVLLELETVLDETPQTPVEDISNDDILRVQVRIQFTIARSIDVMTSDLETFVSEFKTVKLGLQATKNRFFGFEKTGLPDFSVSAKTGLETPL